MRIRKGVSVIGIYVSMLIVFESGFMFQDEKTINAAQQPPTTIEEIGDVVTINPSGENIETTAPDFVFEFDDTESKTDKETQIQTTTGKEVLTGAKTKAKLPKIKIKKVVKKRSAKKMRIYLKNTVKGADGYIVFVYIKKSSAKKNKNLFLKKVIKKNRKKILIKQRKLQRKNELFVKICAFKKVENKMVIISKYSKITKNREK